MAAPLRRVATWLGQRPWLPALGPVVLPVDRFLSRYTHGRWTLVRIAGLPSLILTVEGRRTGLPREVPLLYVPIGDDCIVAGSNWGGRNHPEWTVNLLAKPTATVNIKGMSHSVVARLLTGVERDEVWSVINKQWPAFRLYAARSGRELRIFRLVRDR